MCEEVRCGDGLQADPDVWLGYSPDRTYLNEPLTLGRSARLRSGTILYKGSRIGNRFATGHHVLVREECDIGDDVSIWSNTVVDYGCDIGNRVKIHANCYVAQYSWICDGAFLAPGVMFANDLYPGRPDSAATMAGPTIEAGAQIGVNATILPFVTIGTGAIVGAGAVVTRDIPPGSVAVGSPARVIGMVGDLKEIQTRLEPIASSPGRYRLKRDRATKYTA